MSVQVEYRKSMPTELRSMHLALRKRVLFLPISLRIFQLFVGFVSNKANVLLLLGKTFVQQWTAKG